MEKKALEARSMNKAILAYIPDVSRMHPESFLRNIRHYKTDIPIILYGENSSQVDVTIPDPAPVKSSKNRVGIHNLVFLHGLEIAQKKRIDRFLYMELDCRIGCDHWAEKMFEEVEHRRDMFMAGTIACYNTKAMKPAQAKAAQDYCSEYTKATGFKVPVFEAKQPRPVGCVFIMGGASIFNTAVASDIFLGFERDLHQKAIQKPAYDLFLGMRTAQLFGANATNKLPFLTCSFSSYGSKINTEAERIEMLRTGKVCAIHQVKTNNNCIWT